MGPVVDETVFGRTGGVRLCSRPTFLIERNQDFAHFDAGLKPAGKRGSDWHRYLWWTRSTQDLPAHYAIDRMRHLEGLDLSGSNLGI
jgi:hypothetical protein